MIKNIAVIGAGTVGVTSLLTVIYEFTKFNKLDDLSITLYHDPNKPKIAVGESTTWMFRRNLDITFGYELASKILAEAKATKRRGTRFNWKEGNNQDFKINYDEHYGVHFNSAIISDLILKYIKDFSFVKIKEENVKDISKLNYDLILDCSGTPEDWNDYIKPEFNSVNSVLLYPHIKEYNEEFTDSTWTKDGWMFGVPLTNRKAFGYLYNNKITNRTDAIQGFKKIAPFIEEDKLKSLNWQFYYRKKLVEKNVIYLGNKLFFYEPAGALPLHFYNATIGKLLEKIEENNFVLDDRLSQDLNNTYYNDVNKMLDLIAFNYVGVINKDTPFWIDTKHKAIKHLKNSVNFQTWLKDLPKQSVMGYWEHPATLMRDYIDGLKINLKELENV